MKMSDEEYQELMKRSKEDSIDLADLIDEYEDDVMNDTTSNDDGREKMSREDYILLMEEYDESLEDWHAMRKVTEDLEEKVRRLFMKMSNTVVED